MPNETYILQTKLCTHSFVHVSRKHAAGSSKLRYIHIDAIQRISFVCLC